MQRGTFIWAVLILVGWADLCRAADHPAAIAPTARVSFVKTVLEHWDALDQNHDGVISVQEIDRAVTDPNITGDEAAAVATLKLAARSKTFTLPRLTRDYFVAYDHRAPAEAPATRSAEAATADPATAPHTTPTSFNWNLYFSASRKRIARGGEDRWTGRFDLDHIRQGPLGDCYLIAAVGSLDIHDPARLTRLMTPDTGDGRITVHFGNGRSIDVVPPTDTELAISSTTTGDGVWLADLEQAFGRDRSLQKGGDSDVDGTDLIASGGDSGQAIGVITGHKVHRIAFAKTLADRKLKADAVLPELRKQLQAAIATHHVITAGVHPYDPVIALDAAGHSPAPPPIAYPPNITLNHAYAVVAYDESADEVEIWNPHGQAFKPKGPPGLTNGYATDHGHFKLPLAEAYQFFTSFTFETDLPVSRVLVKK